MLPTLMSVTDARGETQELSLLDNMVLEAWIPPPSMTNVFFLPCLFIYLHLFNLSFFQVSREAFMGVLKMLARSHALVRQVCHDMGEEITSQRQRYRAHITEVWVCFIFLVFALIILVLVLVYVVSDLFGDVDFSWEGRPGGERRQLAEGLLVIGQPQQRA